MDRVDHWLACGAQPSDTVASFIRKTRKAAKEAETAEATATA
jgi:ribosomal protein S16